MVSDGRVQSLERIGARGTEGLMFPGAREEGRVLIALAVVAATVVVVAIVVALFSGEGGGLGFGN